MFLISYKFSKGESLGMLGKLTNKPPGIITREIVVYLIVVSCRSNRGLVAYALYYLLAANLVVTRLY